MTRRTTKGDFSYYCTIPSPPPAAQTTGHDSSNINGVGPRCLRKIAGGSFVFTEETTGVGTFHSRNEKQDEMIDASRVGGGLRCRVHLLIDVPLPRPPIPPPLFW